MIASSKILAIGLALVPVSILGVISDQVQIAFISAIVAIVTSIPAIMMALRTTNRKIDELKVNTDGKLTQLMAATSRADKAESKLEEKAEAKSEAAVIAAAISKPDVSAPVAAPSASAPNVVTTNVPALSLVAKDVTVTKKSL